MGQMTTVLKSIGKIVNDKTIFPSEYFLTLVRRLPSQRKLGPEFQIEVD